MKALPFLLFFLGMTNIVLAQNVPYFDENLKKSLDITKDSGSITAVQPVNQEDEIPQVFFYVAGAFKGSGSNPDPETKTTSGEIGFTFIQQESLFATLGFSLSTIGEVDSKNGDFGNAMLMPGVGKNSFFGDIRRFDIYKNFGVGAEANWTVSEWKWTDAEATEHTLSSAPILLKLFTTWVPFSITANDSSNFINNFTLAFDLGYSMRTLANEAAQNKEFLLDVFNTEKTTYHGVELGVSARLNDF